jgi:hypothetical protein
LCPDSTSSHTRIPLLLEHDGNLGYGVLAANNKQHDSAFICLLVMVCIYLYTLITTVSFPHNLNSGYAIASGKGVVGVTSKQGTRSLNDLIGSEELRAEKMNVSVL